MILCIGEMMVELSRAPDGTLRQGFGGDTFNTAAYLARLGQPTGYLTALGDDPWSAEARAALSAEGVSDAAIPTVPGRTMALYAIRTAPNGERSFTYWRDTSPARDLFGALFTPATRDAILAARLIYLSGITLWLYDDASLNRLFALLHEARSNGAQVAFDGNYRPRLWGPDTARPRAIYARMPALTDICLATSDDEAALWGDNSPAESHRRLTAAGVAEVTVKCGPDGALISPGQIIATTPNPAPVDTTAAGDSFNAAYLAARLTRQPQAEAARAGNALAARVIAHPGALIPRTAMP